MPSSPAEPALRQLTEGRLFIVFGCGGDDNPVDPGPGNDPDPEVSSYMEDLPTWDEFSPPMLTADVPVDTSTSCLDQVEDVRYLCVETPMSLTDTPAEVVTFDAGGITSRRPPRDPDTIRVMNGAS